MANELTFTVTARPYAGRDPVRLARFAADSAAAAVLERYLLAHVTPGRPHAETYAAIAGKTGLDPDTVKAVLSRDRGGDYGISW